ncbi:MAG: hypothetical protein ACETWR_19065 [Anaerolineae bacterium]
MNMVLFHNCRYLISRPTPFGGILENGAIYIEDPIIKAVGPSAEIRRGTEARETWRLSTIARAQEWCDEFAAYYAWAKAAGTPMFTRVHEEFIRI